MKSNFPKQTSIVIIGGGIMGCSTAYHLTKNGCQDVILLERAKLTCGTTWHSAAQVRQLRSTESLTRLVQKSVNLYSNLEKETGQATGWKETGSLSIANNQDRLTHIRKQASLSRAFGIGAEEITVKKASENELKGILDYSDIPLVSTDILKNPHSSIYDASSTQILNNNHIKVVCWYDNEWGYSNRVVDLLEKLSKNE